MRFKNESQRRAVFASMGNRFSDKPRIVQMETPIGTLQAKEEFAKEMETATIQRLPKKKGIVDIIKEEGGTPDKFELSLRPLADIKGEYSAIFDGDESYEDSEKKAIKFLKKHSKSKRADISGWANKELNGMYMDAKTAREEARMEDPSKGTDPDWDAPDGTDFGSDNDYSSDPKKRRTVKQKREDAEVDEYFDMMEKAEAGVKEDEKKALKSPFGYRVDPKHATYIVVESVDGDSEFSSKSDSEDIIKKLRGLEVSNTLSPRLKKKIHVTVEKFEDTTSKPIFDKDGEIILDVDVVSDSERRAMFKKKWAELGIDRSDEDGSKFSLSDAGAKRHDELRKELYKKKESGVPVEELRKEFVDGMGGFIAKRNPGEDMGDYIKRANTEVKLIEPEAEYLAKLALRK
jgi:hypothetical protein